MEKSIRWLIALTIGTILCLFGTAASFAAVISAAGGPLIRVDTRSNTDIATTSSASYVNVPNAQIRIIIPPAGGSRLVVARFSAESKCSGTAEGAACSVRIIALNAGTSVATEMHPQMGIDFAFDSVSSPDPDNDGAEGHSLERSLRLNPGTYLIRVQWAVSAANTTFELDGGWHMMVSQYD